MVNANQRYIYEYTKQLKFLYILVNRPQKRPKKNFKTTVKIIWLEKATGIDSVVVVWTSRVVVVERLLWWPVFGGKLRRRCD